jgi:hypothetical protein
MNTYYLVDDFFAALLGEDQEARHDLFLTTWGLLKISIRMEVLFRKVWSWILRKVGSN